MAFFALPPHLPIGVFHNTIRRERAILCGMPFSSDLGILLAQAVVVCVQHPTDIQK